MGEVSARLADLSIVTSDNPRFENPGMIMDDIVTGIKREGGSYVCIEDRMEAIRYAIENSRKGDVIVLAGKGHEDYQEICGVKKHMDERELVAQIMADRENGDLSGLGRPRVASCGDCDGYEEGFCRPLRQAVSPEERGFDCAFGRSIFTVTNGDGELLELLIIDGGERVNAEELRKWLPAGIKESEEYWPGLTKWLEENEGADSGLMIKRRPICPVS